jgi:hypothetical protein
MEYLAESLELFISKVAYTTNNATSLVRWSNYSQSDMKYESTEVMQTLLRWAETLAGTYSLKP